MLKKEFRMRAIKAFMKKASGCDVAEKIFSKIFTGSGESEIDVFKFVEILAEVYNRPTTELYFSQDDNKADNIIDKIRKGDKTSTGDLDLIYKGLILRSRHDRDIIERTRRGLIAYIPKSREYHPQFLPVRGIVQMIADNTPKPFEKMIERYEDQLIQKIVEESTKDENFDVAKCYKYLIFKNSKEALDKRLARIKRKTKEKKERKEIDEETSERATENKEKEEAIEKQQERLREIRDAETAQEIERIKREHEEELRKEREKHEKIVEEMLRLPGDEDLLKELQSIDAETGGFKGIDPIEIEINKKLKQLQNRIKEKEIEEGSEEEGSLRRSPRYRSRPNFRRQNYEYNQSGDDDYFVSYAKKRLAKFKK